ncbi:MAG: recombinase family protein [Pseudomonadota bacterium]
MADWRNREEPRNQALRCAIYTRKSSEEGLEQDFNSLDAQREACESFIKSQRHEGWQQLPAYYDDGGISGGTMERPSLKRLLTDIQSGRIDIVVVYKVDRLTRSLADFAKIVEVFDQQRVSFVSVTQQFNTTSSMGRLTLNVLLSFAQFEREVTGERIRDKIAASKQKGMWMGGNLPMGYDTEDRKLIINEMEANVVRHIYQRYVALGSVDDLKNELKRQGVLSKVRPGRQGRTHGGIPFARGALYHLLQNRLYIGEIVHKDKHYPGNHEAIVPKELWEQAQQITKENRNASQSRAQAPSLLAGLLFDETGERLIPSHANKSGMRYRYYVTKRPKEEGQDYTRNLRIPAGDIEGVVLKRLQDFLGSRNELAHALNDRDEDALENETLISRAFNLSQLLQSMTTSETRALLLRLVHRIEVAQKTIILHLDRFQLTSVINNPMSQIESLSTSGEETIPLTVPVQLKRQGLSLRLIIEGQATDGSRQPDANVLKLIAKAFKYQHLLITGNGESLSAIAEKEGVTTSYFTRVLRISLLDKTTIESILLGNKGITISKLLSEAS